MPYLWHQNQFSSNFFFFQISKLDFEKKKNQSRFPRSNLKSFSNLSRAGQKFQVRTRTRSGSAFVYFCPNSFYLDWNFEARKRLSFFFIHQQTQLQRGGRGRGRRHRQSEIQRKISDWGNLQIPGFWSQNESCESFGEIKSNFLIDSLIKLINRGVRFRQWIMNNHFNTRNARRKKDWKIKFTGK